MGLTDLRSSFLAQQRALAAQRSAIDAQEAAILQCLEALDKGEDSELKGDDIQIWPRDPMRLKEAGEWLCREKGWARSRVQCLRFQGKHREAFFTTGEGRNAPVYVDVRRLWHLEMGIQQGAA